MEPQLLTSDMQTESTELTTLSGTLTTISGCIQKLDHQESQVDFVDIEAQIKVFADLVIDAYLEQKT